MSSAQQNEKHILSSPLFLWLEIVRMCQFILLKAGSWQKILL